jgi:hypothetical protein
MLSHLNSYNLEKLHRMVQLVAVFPDEDIVAALRRELSWTNFKRLDDGGK